MTVVEEIRRTAALMRKRAEAARPVPPEVWWQYFSSSEGAYYASWHPATALAVADLLDTLAVGIESAAADRCENAYIDEAAVSAVIHAYLRDAP